MVVVAVLRRTIGGVLRGGNGVCELSYKYGNIITIYGWAPAYIHTWSVPRAHFEKNRPPVFFLNSGTPLGPLALL